MLYSFLDCSGILVASLHVIGIMCITSYSLVAKVIMKRVASETLLSRRFCSSLIAVLFDWVLPRGEPQGSKSGMKKSFSWELCRAAVGRASGERLMVVWTQL